MYDLNSFYHSKQWQKLLDQIKHERLNEDGNIICEYCEKPIVRAYDIIGHHKVELTEENVNDFEVSLNPENIQLVHHRCHNYIHNKLGYSMREVFLVYGAPCSGKHTWVRDNMNEGDLIVDIDNIWMCVSGLNRFQKPNRLKSIVFKQRDSLIDSVKYRFGKWQNAYILGGYPLQSERERLCRDLGAREVFIDTDKAECIRRAEMLDEIEDKEEFKGYIEEWFDRFNPPCRE
jgi:hypothetical protein